jgi:hypothetical protein
MYNFLACRSAGCVFAELMLGQPIFPGDSGVDQLVEIIKVFKTIYALMNYRGNLVELEG